MTLAGSAVEAARRLAAVADRVLLGLDFDGTLSPIVADPEQAYAHPRSVDALARLAPRLALVAVVTGRPALTAVRLGGLKRDGLERLVVLGQYGVERWDATHGLLAPGAPAAITAARERLAAVLEGLALTGVTLEDKGRALGVHTRNAEDPQAALEALRQPVADLAADLGLRVEPGRLVWEVRAGGRDKGGALRDLLTEYRPTAAAFVGDDLGDLPAWDAISAFAAAGGLGVRVCSASAEQPELARAADVVLDGPDAVAEWLDLLADLVDGATTS